MSGSDVLREKVAIVTGAGAGIGRAVAMHLAVFERELNFPNDRLLAEELAHENYGAYGLLAGALKDEIPPVRLPAVVKRVDAEVAARMRLGGTGEDLKKTLRTIIHEVLAELDTNEKDQLGLPGIGPPK